MKTLEYPKDTYPQYKEKYTSSIEAFNKLNETLIEELNRFIQNAPDEYDRFIGKVKSYTHHSISPTAH
mgnify:CR=1 FL=1